jgi:serine/threonine protein kinase
MAPEALKKGIYSSAGDVWSFAVFAYECFTRASMPYDGMPTMECVRLVLNGHRLTYPDKVPRRLVRLFNRCMNHKPGKRPTFDAICGFLEDGEDGGSDGAEKVIYANITTLMRGVGKNTPVEARVEKMDIDVSTAEGEGYEDLDQLKGGSVDAEGYDDLDQLKGQIPSAASNTDSSATPACESSDSTETSSSTSAETGEVLSSNDASDSSSA